MRYKKLRSRLNNCKIGVVISVFYFALIVTTTCVCSLSYRQIYLNISQKKVNEVSVQTLNSIQTNINLMINNADNLSQMVLSNHDLQELLREGSMYNDLNRQSKVSSYLYNLIQSAPYIDSIYILDNSNSVYSVGENVLPSITSDKIINSDWYKQVIDKKGSFILELNGGGVTFEKTKENYISLIRLVRDMEDMERIGVLVINIPQKSFKQIFDNISTYVEADIAILDENNKKIISLNDLKTEKYSTEDNINISNEIIKSGEEFLERDTAYKMKKINNIEYLFSYSSQNDYDWKVISVIPFTNISKENMTMILIGFVIIAVNGLILFAGTILISRIITVPIKSLLKSMKDIENSVFNEVKIKTYSYELKKLCSGYNIMILEIKKLIARVIKEQKAIRKAELYTFQAQIKPHFLYNTLDSINSLALSNGNLEVSELVESLANYYRLSVSKGKEIITIREEVEMVKNYLKIQMVRYPEMFDAEYSIGANCLECKVPKLIIQPLVENALYHGIRAKGKRGTIKICIENGNGTVMISVEDNGIGMSVEKINEIVKFESINKKEGFGLRGTFERIRIFCGNNDACKIESKLNVGTKILLFITTGHRED